MKLTKKSNFPEWLKINRGLLPVKLHYFIFFTALAAVLPFRTVFAKQLGVSATAVGVIFTAVPFMKLVTNPLFGAILDYFKRFRLTLTIIMLVVAASHLSMVFIPPLQPRQMTHINVSCNSMSESHFHQCFLTTSVPHLCQLHCDLCLKNKTHGESEISKICSPNCDQDNRVQLSFNISLLRINSKNATMSSRLIESMLSTEVNTSQICPCVGSMICYIGNNCNPDVVSCLQKVNIHGRKVFLNYSGEDGKVIFNHSGEDQEVFFKQSEEDEEVFLTLQFWLLLLLMAISSVSFAAVLFLMDAICYEILDDKPDKYGQQRLWGTIGWGIGALAGGYLNQIFSKDFTTINYAPGFYLLVILTLIDLLPLLWIKVTNIRYSKNIFKDVGVLFSQLYVLIYISMVFFIGILSGFIWNYQFWFLEEIGASQLLLGLSQTVECFLAELPCFIVAGAIIRKIGHMNCVTLTFAFFAARYLWFAYMENPWYSLPAGFLHGPTFGLFFTSMTMFAKTEAPPGTEATVQALLAVLFEGVGAAVGSILGGIGIDTFGSRATFMYAAEASLVLTFISGSVHLLLIYKSRKKKKTVFPVKEELSPKQSTTL